VAESANAKSRWMCVSSKKFIGKKLGAAEMTHHFGVIITRIRRHDVDFIPSSNFILEAGDELRVSGSPQDLDRFEQAVTRDRQSIYQTDLFSFAFGLAMGVLLGLIKIPITDKLTMSLGIAGGPLIMGLLFGYFGRFGRITGTMPQAANFIVGELGLYLFLGAAGCMAGGSFVSTLKEQGLLLIPVGLIITLMPMIVTVVLAGYLFKTNRLVLLGMLCGGMTSTPALGVLMPQTNSDVPALAYTGIYPIAILLTTLMAQMLVLF